MSQVSAVESKLRKALRERNYLALSRYLNVLRAHGMIPQTKAIELQTLITNARLGTGPRRNKDHAKLEAIIKSL